MREEAEELAGTAFGRTLLSKISYVYHSQALQEGAGGRMAELGASLRQTGHTWGNRFGVVKTAVKTLSAVRSMSKAAEEAERVGKIKVCLCVCVHTHAYIHTRTHTHRRPRARAHGVEHVRAVTFVLDASRGVL
jgi:hypothetical protein